MCQGNERCQRELRRAQVTSSTRWRYRKLSLQAGVARALPSDPKANNSTSFPTLSLFLHSRDRACAPVCVWLCVCVGRGGQVDQGAETPVSVSIQREVRMASESKPKFKVPSLHSTPAELSTTHPSSCWSLDTNLSDTQFPERDTGFKGSSKAHAACHIGDRKPGF